MENNLVEKAKVYFSTIFVVPFLGILSAALVIVGILLPVCITANYFGAFSSFLTQRNLDPIFKINFGFFIFPHFLNIPVGIIAGVLFFCGGRKVGNTLKRYLAYVRAI